jgi:hypothetical protein
MAALTWRNVAAPDFSGVQGGISNAGEFFNRAFSGGQKTVENIQNIREDNAVKEVLGRALASNDPAAIQAMAAEAAQNPNFTLRGLDTLNRQVDTLQRRNLTEEQILGARQGREQGATLFNRGEQEYSAREAARGEILKLYGSGMTPDKIAQAAASNPILAALPTKDLMGIIDDSYNRRDRNLNYDIRSTEFANSQADRNDAFVVADALSTIDQSSLTDEERFSALERMRGNLTPRQYTLARNRLMGGGTGGAGGGEFAAPASGSFSAGGSNYAFGAPQKAYADVFSSAGVSNNVVAGLLGNAHVEGGWTGKEGDGGAAGGIVQWRDGRRDAFIQRNGVDPTKASPEVQARHVMWELSTPEGRKVAGITEQQANAILNAKSPEEAAEYIDRFYERSSGQHRQQRIAAAAAYGQLTRPGDPVANGLQGIANSVDTDRARAQQGGSVGARILRENAGSKKDRADVISDVMTSLGASDRGTVENIFNDMRNRFLANGWEAPNDAIIGAALKTGSTYDRRLGDRIWDWTGNLFGATDAVSGGLQVDRDNLYNRLKDIVQSPQASNVAVVEAQRNAGEQAASVADAQYQQARAQREYAENEVRSGRRPNINLKPYYDRENQALATSQAANAAVRNSGLTNPGVQPVGSSTGKPTQGTPKSTDDFVRNAADRRRQTAPPPRASNGWQLLKDTVTGIFD